jgi:hypothetical protein
VIQKDLVVIADGAHVGRPQYYRVNRLLTDSAETSQPLSAKKLQLSKRPCLCIAFLSQWKRSWMMRQREAFMQTNVQDS